MKTNDTTEYNKKKIGRFILLFIVLVMVLSNSTIREKIFNLVSKDDRTLQVIKEINIETLNEYQLAVIDNKIIIYSQEGLYRYDFNGNGQPIIQKNLNNSIITVDESNIYIISKDDGQIQTFKSNGDIVWNYNLNRKIDHGFIEGNHLLLISMTTEGYQHITIIDFQGDLKQNIVIKEGQAVLADIFKGGDEVIVGTINNIEQQIISNLIKYSKEGELLWVETFENEIIQKVKYLQDRSCILVTDKKIYHLSKQKELLWSRKNNEDIWDIKINDDNQTIVVLFRNHLEIIDLSGRTKNKIALNEEFDKIKYDKNIIYLHNNKSILGIMEKSKFLKYKDNNEIKSIDVTTENIIIKLNNKIKIMDIVRTN